MGVGDGGGIRSMPTEPLAELFTADSESPGWDKPVLSPSSTRKSDALQSEIFCGKHSALIPADKPQSKYAPVRNAKPRKCT